MIRPSTPADVLIVDVDNTILPFLTGFMAPAVTAGAGRIARIFQVDVETMVRALAPAMKRHGHDNPWLLEFAGMRERFSGSDQRFIDEVVRPFWQAWDEAAETCGQAYPGVKQTFSALEERGKVVYALSNGRDFCVVQRLKAAGLTGHLAAVAAVRVRNTGGFDTTIYNERRARILGNNSEIELIVLEEVAAKPSGAGLLTIMERAAVEPGQCIFTGDAIELDGVAAISVGVPYVLMNNGLLFIPHDFDAMYGRASLQREQHRFRHAVPVMHEAHSFAELLEFF